MAFIDPSNLSHLKSVTQRDRFQLKIHHVAPESIVPNGDRYVVEVIDLDETVELGQMLVVTQDPTLDPKDPRSDPKIEQRGVMAAVIVTRGNGHLLGLPDPRFVMHQNPMNDMESIVREKADVPMFYQPGDVVFVDHNAKGRNVKIVGRECRIVNQIDVLAKIEGIKLERTEDGDWKQVDAE